MFCAANARPRWDAGRNEMFDGKMGMWPIATQVPAAARSSRNSPAGTLEWKSHSMTKQVYTKLVFEQLVPAILKNWPRANKRVLIQQDNAMPFKSTMTKSGDTLLKHFKKFVMTFLPQRTDPNQAIQYL
jgi:hypothetical protein